MRKLLCNHCGKYNLQLATGLETLLMLQCRGCKEYHYFVGDIWCVNFGDTLFGNWGPDDIKSTLITASRKLRGGHKASTI